MITINLNTIKNLLFAVIALILLMNTCTPALAQQDVIANKDVTRPELQKQLAEPAFVTVMKAENKNGYNEISWSSRRDQDVQRFYVEYSTDGINFQSAGDVVVNTTGSYRFQHYIGDPRSMLYRISMQMNNNRRANTESFFLQGTDLAPVYFYPTIITGNTLNINAGWPLRRMTVVSTSGQQVYAKDLNGQSDHIPVVLPTLAKGMYIVTFFGDGWKHSDRMIVS